MTFLKKGTHSFSSAEAALAPSGVPCLVQGFAFNLKLLMVQDSCIFGHALIRALYMNNNNLLEVPDLREI